MSGESFNSTPRRKRFELGGLLTLQEIIVK